MKVNPLAPWTDDDIAGYKRDHELLEHPLAVAGLPVDRLLAVHPSGRRRRGPACGPLGGQRQDRVRPATAGPTMTAPDPPSAYDAHAHAPTAARLLSHLDALESESIHLLREVAAEFERPVLLFSGGKDSVVMLHIADEGVLAGADCRSR